MDLVLKPEIGMGVHEMVKKVIETYHLSFETLSICSGIPIPDIELLYHQEDIHTDMDSAYYFMCILMHLQQNPLSDDYIPGLIDSLTTVFHIKLESLAECCHVSPETLNNFIENPKSVDQNSYLNIVMHVFHLFSALTKTNKEFPDNK